MNQHHPTWSPLPRSGTGLDSFVDAIITELSGLVVRADDPLVRERLLSFLNARPVGFVVGSPEELARADRDFCDSPDHSLLFVSSADEARRALEEGREIYGLYLAKPTEAHLRLY